MDNPHSGNNHLHHVSRLTLLIVFLVGAILTLQIVGFVWMFSMSSEIKEMERRLDAQEPKTKIIQLWKRGG